METVFKNSIFMDDFVKVVNDIYGIDKNILKKGDIVKLSDIKNNLPYLYDNYDKYFSSACHKYKKGDKVEAYANYGEFTIVNLLYSGKHKMFGYRIKDDANRNYDVLESQIKVVKTPKYYIARFTDKIEVKECKEGELYPETYSTPNEAYRAAYYKLQINNILSKLKGDPNCDVDIDFNKVDNLEIIYNILENYYNKL